MLEGRNNGVCFGFLSHDAVTFDSAAKFRPQKQNVTWSSGLIGWCCNFNH